MCTAGAVIPPFDSLPGYAYGGQPLGFGVRRHEGLPSASSVARAHVTDPVWSSADRLLACLCFRAWRLSRPGSLSDAWRAAATPRWTSSAGPSTPDVARSYAQQHTFAGGGGGALGSNLRRAFSPNSWQSSFQTQTEPCGLSSGSSSSAVAAGHTAASAGMQRLIGAANTNCSDTSSAATSASNPALFTLDARSRAAAQRKSFGPSTSTTPTATSSYVAVSGDAVFTPPYPQRHRAGILSSASPSPATREKNHLVVQRTVPSSFEATAPRMPIAGLSQLGGAPPVDMQDAADNAASSSCASAREAARQYTTSAHLGPVHPSLSSSAPLGPFQRAHSVAANPQNRPAFSPWSARQAQPSHAGQLNSAMQFGMPCETGSCAAAATASSHELEVLQLHRQLEHQRSMAEAREAEMAELKEELGRLTLQTSHRQELGRPSRSDVFGCHLSTKVVQKTLRNGFSQAQSQIADWMQDRESQQKRFVDDVFQAWSMTVHLRKRTEIERCQAFEEARTQKQHSATLEQELQRVQSSEIALRRQLMDTEAEFRRALSTFDSSSRKCENTQKELTRVRSTAQIRTTASAAKAITCIIHARSDLEEVMYLRWAFTTWDAQLQIRRGQQRCDVLQTTLNELSKKANADMMLGELMHHWALQARDDRWEAERKKLATEIESLQVELERLCNASEQARSSGREVRVNPEQSSDEAADDAHPQEDVDAVMQCQVRRTSLEERQSQLQNLMWGMTRHIQALAIPTLGADKAAASLFRDWEPEDCKHNSVDGCLGEYAEKANQVYQTPAGELLEISQSQFFKDASTQVVEVRAEEVQTEKAKERKCRSALPSCNGHPGEGSDKSSQRGKAKTNGDSSPGFGGAAWSSTMQSSPVPSSVELSLRASSPSMSPEHVVNVAEERTVAVHARTAPADLRSSMVTKFTMPQGSLEQIRRSLSAPLLQEKPDDGDADNDLVSNARSLQKEGLRRKSADCTASDMNSQIQARGFFADTTSAASPEQSRRPSTNSSRRAVPFASPNGLCDRGDSDQDDAEVVTDPEESDASNDREATEHWSVTAEKLLVKRNQFLSKGIDYYNRCVMYCVWSVLVMWTERMHYLRVMKSQALRLFCSEAATCFSAWRELALQSRRVVRSANSCSRRSHVSGSVTLVGHVFLTWAFSHQFSFRKAGKLLDLITRAAFVEVIRICWDRWAQCRKVNVGAVEDEALDLPQEPPSAHPDPLPLSGTEATPPRNSGGRQMLPDGDSEAIRASRRWSTRSSEEVPTRRRSSIQHLEGDAKLDALVHEAASQAAPHFRVAALGEGKYKLGDFEVTAKLDGDEAVGKKGGSWVPILVLLQELFQDAGLAKAYSHHTSDWAVGVPKPAAKKAPAAAKSMAPPKASNSVAAKANQVRRGSLGGPPAKAKPKR